MGKVVTAARWLFCIEEVLVLMWLLLSLDVSHPFSAAFDCIEEVLVWLLLRLNVSHPSSAAGTALKRYWCGCCYDCM